MSTKVCEQCGWVYPATTSCRTCIVCGGRISKGTCPSCGKYSERIGKLGLCRECYNAQYRVHAGRRRRAEIYADYAAIYKKWLDKIKSLPADYPTLTEAQWLEACRHFNGCAYCNSESIDARTYFIEFSEGGRYCDWNIVPACERCASAARIQKDPFKRLIDINKKQVLFGIVDYLEVKLDAAVAQYAKGSECADTKADNTK